MKISFDETKRRSTLENRGPDLADASGVFQQLHLNAIDERIDYGEERYITFGHLNDRAVIIVRTPRGDTERRIISMRYANDRERKRYEAILD